MGCKNPRHFATTDQIKREIIDNGPVVANMVVFRDLLTYIWGIYWTEGVFEQMIGAHAVLIEGFGNQLG